MYFFEKGTWKKWSMEWNIGCIRLWRWLYSTGFRAQRIRHRIRRLFTFKCVCTARVWRNQRNNKAACFVLHFWWTVYIWFGPTLCAWFLYGKKCHSRTFKCQLKKIKSTFSSIKSWNQFSSIIYKIIWLNYPSGKKQTDSL